MRAQSLVQRKLDTMNPLYLLPILAWVSQNVPLVPESDALDVAPCLNEICCRNLGNQSETISLAVPWLSCMCEMLSFVRPCSCQVEVCAGECQFSRALHSCGFKTKPFDASGFAHGRCYVACSTLISYKRTCVGLR